VTLVINKSVYDEFCDRLISLSTLAKQFDKTTSRKLSVVIDLISQCTEDRTRIVEKVKNLETLLKSMRIDNGTEKHNNSSQSD